MFLERSIKNKEKRISLRENKTEYFISGFLSNFSFILPVVFIVYEIIVCLLFRNILLSMDKLIVDEPNLLMSFLFSSSLLFLFCFFLLFVPLIIFNHLSSYEKLSNKEAEKLCLFLTNQDGDMKKNIKGIFRKQGFITHGQKDCINQLNFLYEKKNMKNKLKNI